MNKRFKKIRLEFKLTQGQFGERLGLKWNQVKDIETEAVKVRPTLVRLLYHEFSVNPEWLVNGKGSVFVDSVLHAKGDCSDYEYCEKLCRILSEGDNAVVSALKQSIDAFHMIILKKSDKRPGDKY